MQNQPTSQQTQASKGNVINLEKGKIPPQATDIEEVVLGAMLIDKKGVDEAIDILQPEVFYDQKHQFIYEAIITLFQEGKPIDLLTVTSQLKEDKKLQDVGGEIYLIQLTQKISSSAHIEYHSRIIIQKYIQRSLIQISGEIIQDSYDEGKDVFDLLDEAESKLYGVTQGYINKASQSAQNLVTEAKKKIEEIANQEGSSGVLSGFTGIDKLTSGWQMSDLVIIAARPSMGKTAFILSMARNMAVGQKVPVGFFSLEMSSVQLITRLISSETEIASEKLRTGDLSDREWKHLNERVKSLEGAPLYVDDTPSLSIFDLRAKARRLSSKHQIKIIFVDYLQLMTSGASNKNGTREQEISTISRNLKALAKELNIPVIALSQLSRNVETRGGSKRPILSDLRESGAIEQDADIVSFIYRPEYYGLQEWDNDMDGGSTEDQAEIIFAKHRNGAIGDVRLKFEKAFGRFEDLGETIGNIPTEISSSMNDDDDDNNIPYY